MWNFKVMSCAAPPESSGKERSFFLSKTCLRYSNSFKCWLETRKSMQCCYATTFLIDFYLRWCLSTGCQYSVRRYELSKCQWHIQNIFTWINSAHFLSCPFSFNFILPRIVSRIILLLSTPFWKKVITITDCQGDSLCSRSRVKAYAIPFWSWGSKLFQGRAPRTAPTPGPAENHNCDFYNL